MDTQKHPILLNFNIFGLTEHTSFQPESSDLKLLDFFGNWNDIVTPKGAKKSNTAFYGWIKVMVGLDYFANDI